MGLICKNISQKYITVIGEQEKNKLIIPNGYINQPMITTEGWDVIIGTGEFVLNGLFYQIDSPVRITITPPPAGQAKVEAIKIRETHGASQNTEVPETITRVDFTYHKQGDLYGMYEFQYVQFDVPVGATSAAQCVFYEQLSQIKTFNEVVNDINQLNIASTSNTNTVADHESRLDAIEGQAQVDLTPLDNRVGTLEQDSIDQDLRLDNLETASTDHESRLDTLEANSGTTDLTAINNNIADHESRLDTLELNAGKVILRQFADATAIQASASVWELVIDLSKKPV